MNIIYILKAQRDPYEFVKQKLNKKVNIFKTPHGKPYIENGEIYFNITHAGDFKAVAIGKAEVGIDAETLRKPDLRVARRFTQAEREYILESDSDNRFFEIWTKKEAYLKYKGSGLSGGLNTFNVLEMPQMFKTFVLNDCMLTVCSSEEYRIEEQNEIQ